MRVEEDLVERIRMLEFALAQVSIFFGKKSYFPVCPHPLVERIRMLEFALAQVSIFFFENILSSWQESQMRVEEDLVERIRMLEFALAQVSISFF